MATAANEAEEAGEGGGGPGRCNDDVNSQANHRLQCGAVAVLGATSISLLLEGAYWYSNRKIVNPACKKYKGSTTLSEKKR